MTITFFDISTDVPGQFGNPNTMKIRHALNYKGIEYETKWLPYHEIQETLKNLGVLPTMLNPNGSGESFWTCPVIHDSDTGMYISNSFDIALYLDKKFPDKPLLFPYGTKTAISLFDTYFMENVMPIIGPMCFAPSRDRLDSKSQVYFTETREQWFGGKLEELCPKGPIRDGAWRRLKSVLNTLSGSYEKSGDDTIYFLGDTISYADFVFASFVYWAYLVNPAPELDWDDFKGWNNGKWARVLEATQKYRV